MINLSELAGNTRNFPTKSLEYFFWPPEQNPVHWYFMDFPLGKYEMHWKKMEVAK